jgi:hypothetical protein
MRGTLTLMRVAVTGNTAGTGGRGGAGSTSGLGASGAAGGSGGQGGGIYNSGALSLDGVTLNANQAGDGGAGGTGLPSGPTGGNGGDGGCCGRGGGVANSSGQVSIRNSTIAQNIAGNGGAGGAGGGGSSSAGAGGVGATGAIGGGIFSVGGSLTVTYSTISGNLAGTGANGGQGGIVGPGNFGAGGAAGDGGTGGGLAVFSGSPAPALLNVTVAENQLGGPGTPGPGGVMGSSGQPGIGGGVYASGSPAISLGNDLLAANASSNCAGTTPTDGGHNLSFGGSGCPAGFATGDPRLSNLSDNGGPTATMELGAGSAAIDQVPASGAGCPATDERGVGRPVGAACDIGAFELALPGAGAPTAVAVAATTAMVSATVTANQASGIARFDYGTTTAYGQSTASEAVAGIGPTVATATLSGLTPGTSYHVRVLVSTSDGTTQSTDTTFTMVAAPAAPGTTAPGTTPPLIPGLSQFALRPSAFLAAPQRGRRTGTTLTYIDSAAAQTTLTVLRIESGTSRGGRCVAPPRHRRARRCTLLAKIGGFTHRDRVGNNQFRFDGRVGGPRLAPGRYQLRLTPRLAARTGNTLTLKFRVLARPRHLS